MGVELWSLQTDEGERWRTPREAIRFLRDPARAITGPPPEHLAAWDALCARRRVPALGGLDAHDYRPRVAGRVLRPIPNERYFGLLRTRVLLEDPLGADVAAAAGQVYGALAEGRCYLAIEGFGSAEGFAFWAEGEDGVVPMGAEGSPGARTLHARTPAPARLRLLRDGRETLALHGTELDHATSEPGVYRIEAHREIGGRQRMWIVSNPLYLTASPTTRSSPPPG
ncbi:MAG TPA: hypothetical protein VGV36_07980 [Solirubrobacteraceae bacterium]|nr:hypothetical protein [Solirubrobacteraceae bacterium]